MLFLSFSKSQFRFQFFFIFIFSIKILFSYCIPLGILYYKGVQDRRRFLSFPASSCIITSIGWHLPNMGDFSPCREINHFYPHSKKRLLVFRYFSRSLFTCMGVGLKPVSNIKIGGHHDYYYQN